MREEALQKIPSNFFYLNFRDRTTQAKGDTECQEFFLGTFTDLIEDPRNMRPEASKDEYRYKDGRVEVRAATSCDGKVRYYIPVVYYCHKRGFIVACRINWGVPSTTRKKNIAAGKTEILGKANNKCCTRYYSIIAAHEDPQEGYLRVKLSSEMCNESKMKFFVHNLCLVAFKGARPPGHVGQHIGERSENRIENLCWIPSSEKQHRRNKRYVSPVAFDGKRKARLTASFVLPLRY